MMKSILLICIFVMIPNIAMASISTSNSFNGDGTPVYPNEGYMFTNTQLSASSNAYEWIETSTYDTLGNTVNYTFKSSVDASIIQAHPPANNICRVDSATKRDTSSLCHAYSNWETTPENFQCVHQYTTTANFYGRSQVSVGSFYGTATGTGSAFLSVLITTNQTYTISGNIDCITGTTLKLQTGEIIEINTSSTYYKFEDLLSGLGYRLEFSNGHIYDFSLTGNEIYDYDACKYCCINLKDYCGNMMTNTSCDIYKSDGGNMATYDFVGTYFRQNPILILIDTDVEEGKMLDIYMDTDMGDYHIIDYCEEKTIDVLHPTKSWSVSFGAFDDITHNPISNIKMVMNQSCKIDPTHGLSQYLFTGSDGYGTFIGMSAEKAHIRMDNDQYGGDRFWIDGLGDAFYTHHIIDTYLNLSDPQDDWYNNTDNLTTGCNIWFVDEIGKRDRHINDTDVYVDLYYENQNCTATLKFQRLYASYWMTKQSWNIPINESGHKRIYNTDFSVADANYRAILYADECECNCTLSLYVSNQTIEEEQHYQNLSAHCRFKHQIGGGQVDYRSPVDISAYAYTNCSHTLLNINLTLYETGSVIASKRCDWADFAGATPKWLYVWSPNVEYDIGKNYTVVMTGYNGLNLDADNVWTSNIRNNALTVRVRDNHNAPIAYSSVFVQGWGSEALGSQTSLTIEGFLDQSYQYKATKSGYVSSGWATANFSGEDLTVTCVLTQSATESVTGYKLKDEEIKSFFIPLMYMLFIMILLGGLMNAVKP